MTGMLLGIGVLMTFSDWSAATHRLDLPHGRTQRRSLAIEGGMQNAGLGRSGLGALQR